MGGKGEGCKRGHRIYIQVNSGCIYNVADTGGQVMFSVIYDPLTVRILEM